MRKIWKLGVLLLCLIVIKEEAFAAGATAFFGTEEGYVWEVGEESPMGFYLASDVGNLTVAELLIRYDPEVLEFRSREEEGVILLSEGEISIRQAGALGSEYKKILHFTPLISTVTTVEITEASGRTEEEEISTEIAVNATVTIPMEEGCELRSIEIEGEQIAGFDPMRQAYELEVEYGVEELPVTVLTHEDTQAEIPYTKLEVGNNQIHIISSNERGQKARYTLTVVRKEEVIETVPEEEEPETVIAIEGEGGTIETEGEETGFETDKNTWKQQVLKASIVLIGFLLVFEVVFLIVSIRVRKKKQNTEPEIIRTEGGYISEEEEPELEIIDFNPVVIKACKVCMDFDRAVNEYTSIKELAIQTAKGKRTKEKFRALNEVSFEIHKGEVIGVIGTNGAGKSTLLKIIAGALYPTDGSIQMDRSKIQILSLGTGFDMELTGKENVYLNGAIIGYRKEFIDEHYDQIVEFAELKEFMNEKVKNYSSGMVSRLGFAIATVGEAAEILILDEVLSVGDRIFQQKSMKRIKEMIHGGSTVIMVSHSTKTISENCSKAIWLEKGNLIAMGNAKRLCEVYEKYDGNFERLMRAKAKRS